MPQTRLVQSAAQSKDADVEYAYVVNYVSGNVSAYVGNERSGAFPYYVAVDPEGKFAYVSNSASNDVSAYTIDATSGALTQALPW